MNQDENFDEMLKKAVDDLFNLRNISHIIIDSDKIREHIKSNYTLVRVDQHAGGLPDFISKDFISIASGGYNRIGEFTLGIDSRHNLSWSLRSESIISAVNTGIAKVLSPFSGSIEQAKVSIGLEWQYIRNQDNYCLASQMGGTMTCVSMETVWVFPSHGLILYVANGLDEQSIITATCNIIFSCIKKSDKLTMHIRSCLNNTAQFIISDFYCPHMSHNLWNIQTGWANVLANSYVSKINHLFYFDNQNFFGNLADLYEDDLDGFERIDKVVSADQLQDYILENGTFLLSVKDEIFSKKFAGQILSQVTKSCDSNFIEKVNKFRNSYYPIILTTVRLDNRSWIEQEAGLAELFNGLSEYYPRLGVVIDGLSSDTVKGWTTGWMSVQSDLDVANEICGQMNANIPVMLAVGRKFSESILLMNACDLFIAPSGSGMGIYKWICNMPGLAFSNKAVLSESSPHRWPLRVWHDPSFRKDVVSTKHLGEEYVTDGDIARDHVSRANFHLDWRDLLAESLKYMNETLTKKC